MQRYETCEVNDLLYQSTQEKKHSAYFWAGKDSATSICYSISMQFLEDLLKKPKVSEYFFLAHTFLQAHCFFGHPDVCVRASEQHHEVPHKDPEFLLFMKPGLTSLTSHPTFHTFQNIIKHHHAVCLILSGRCIQPLSC